MKIGKAKLNKLYVLGFYDSASDDCNSITDQEYLLLIDLLVSSNIPGKATIIKQFSQGLINVATVVELIVEHYKHRAV